MGIAVEGLVDAAAATRLLQGCGHEVDSRRVIVARGKTALDPRIPSLNRSAGALPWLVLRDADRDGDDCPVTLRSTLVTTPQAALLSLRLAVRSLEAWMLADAAAVADYFRLRSADVPTAPESEVNAKRALVRACRRSKLRSVREGMGRPTGEEPGPEYTAMLTTFVSEVWDPTRAAAQAPSLGRALADVTARFGQVA